MKNIKLPGERNHTGIWILIILMIIIIIYLLWKKPELIDSIKSLIFK